jgi:hypothetical protein
MKKLLSILAVMLIAISADAQAPFTYYRPAQPSTGGGNYSQPSYNYGNGYGNSYGNSNSYYNSTPRYSQPQAAQVLSTRGYYYKDNQWHAVLLRVKIVDEKVYVVGIKRSTTGWSEQSSRASSTNLLQKEIRDVFDYYVNDYVYGRIYF